jgi:hydrogenase maturation protein HypF
MNNKAPQEKKQDKGFRQRLRVTIRGAVQGVGFRPFIYRLATELGLTGWVNNSSSGVVIEVEGTATMLEKFLLRLEPEKPARSFFQSLEYIYLDPHGYETFEITESDYSGSKSALVLPDIAICPDCLKDIYDSENRRYLYPFTNCTNCGPRYSIITALPYDRPNTTMGGFKMCDDCRAEYENPLNRRFHAQPNACPVCGPHLELWSNQSKVLAIHNDALQAAAEVIRSGSIVAVKGIGGFHLMVDARNDDAVRRLRQLKGREEKPFALLYPSLEMIKRHCEVSDLEERLLLSPESPIVLLSRRPGSDVSSTTISSEIAPNNPYLGIMLPYTPLHHILMEELGFPLVATSGNISDEPICIDEHEALARLGSIAEYFLVHNRPIVRPIDDSVVRVIMGRELVIRRARGYAPLPIHSGADLPRILAVGAHLKNTVAVSVGRDIFISQHIGDLETSPAYDSFHKSIGSLQELYEFNPEMVTCDMHPAYLSTQYAEKMELPIAKVQHHYAHILSCMAENELAAPVLGVAWDGTGYGLDGTVWGGEFLKISDTGFERSAFLKPFPLPGGEKAIKEPRRTALGLLYEMFGREVLKRLPPALSAAFPPNDLAILVSMLEKSINSHYTSSAGRLFDAVASIIGLRQIVKYEGQAAMELEFTIDGIKTDENYSFAIDSRSEGYIIDWRSIITGVIDDLENNRNLDIIAAKFHNSMSEIIVKIAHTTGERNVVLSGGCFQNKYLTERTVNRLRAEGFHPYWHQRIPPNDGGIALGQIMAANRVRAKE